MRPTLGRLAAALLLASLALPAQAAPRGRHGLDPERRREAVADSARSLAGRDQVWGHVGLGWIATPRDVRPHYNAGVNAGLAADHRFADRVALGVRADYLDFPAKLPDVVLVNGVSYQSLQTFGHGWSLLGLGTVSFRVWNHFWLEGGAGGGYLSSGYPLHPTTSDSLQGGVSPFENPTGWGPAWQFGLRYEFMPDRRDRVLGEVLVTSLKRKSWMRLWGIRVGYRLR